MNGGSLSPASRLPHPVSPLPCPKCGVVDLPVVSPGTGPHFAAAWCGHCSAFIKFLSRYSKAQREAKRQQARQAAMEKKAPSALQLSYLEALGHAGPCPESMAQASALIDMLRNEPATKGQQL